MSDPCECFFDHELAMNRLISMLRSSQADCTDTGCDNSGTSREGGDPLIFWTLLWTFMAMALYVMRPNSMRSGARGNRQELQKQPRGGADGDNDDDGASGSGGSGGFDNSPPPPPPAAL